MPRRPESPILVTGTHRSGSTWLGRVLACSGQTEYVDEPFHVRHRRGTCRAKTDTWYLYVTDANQQETGYGDALPRTVEFRYSPIVQLKSLERPSDGLRMFRDWARFALARWSGKRALIKDPIAFFSAPWISERFDADVVILLRHPAAFASSLKRLDWQFDFRNWLEQPLLVNERLRPWEEEIRQLAKTGGSIIEQAAMIWKVIYGLAEEYQENHPDWIFIKHEDLSLDPLTRFPDLFERLGLEYTEAAREFISKTTSPDNPREAPQGRAHALARDSKAKVESWRSRLTTEEVERLRASLDGAADYWYPDLQW